MAGASGLVRVESDGRTNPAATAPKVTVEFAARGRLVSFPSPACNSPSQPSTALSCREVNVQLTMAPLALRKGGLSRSVSSYRLRTQQGTQFAGNVQTSTTANMDRRGVVADPETVVAGRPIGQLENVTRRFRSRVSVWVRG